MSLNINSASYFIPRVTFKGSNQDDDYWLNLNLKDTFKSVRFRPTQVSVSALSAQNFRSIIPELYQNEDTFTSSPPGDVPHQHASASESASASAPSNVLTALTSEQAEKTPEEISQLFVGRIPTNAVFEEWQKVQQEKASSADGSLSSQANLQNNAELQKLKSKASMVKITTTCFLGGAAFATHWIPGVNIATAAIVIPVRSIMNMAIDFYYKPGNKIREKISVGVQKLKTWLSSTFFKKSGSPRFAGSHEQEMSQVSSQKSTAAQVVNNFMSGISVALSKLEQAVTQNNPQMVLDVQKDVMNTTKTLVDQLGTEEDKQKANKAELAYKHYEQFVDTLDLTAPKLTYGDLPSMTQEHLHMALYYALTSKNNDLVQWAKKYSKNLGIKEFFTQAIINSSFT